MTLDPNFPVPSDVHLDLPAECPVAVGGNTNIQYSASGDFPAGSMAPNFLQVTNTNRTGNVTSIFVTQAWSSGGTRQFVNVNGQLMIATGGFDDYGQGFDNVHLQFNHACVSTTATTRIGYNFGPASSRIAAPATTEPNQWYSVRAATNDPLMVGTLTWTWYLNGSYYASGTTPDLSVYAGSPNSSQTLEATATDVNGRTVTGSQIVYMGSGCGDGDQCGEGLRRRRP